MVAIEAACELGSKAAQLRLFAPESIGVPLNVGGSGVTNCVTVQARDH